MGHSNIILFNKITWKIFLERLYNEGTLRNNSEMNMISNFNVPYVKIKKPLND